MSIHMIYIPVENLACYQHGRDKTPRPNNQLFVIDLRAITHMGVYTVPGRGRRGATVTQVGWPHLTKVMFTKCCSAKR